MEISAGWVSAGASAGGLVVTVAGLWIRSAFEKRDEKIKELRDDLATKKAEHNADVAGLKATQKLLFDKLDALSLDLQNYKLHVAETYVNREVLREQLAPINKALDNIQEELRGK